jgi:hypothetical protein
VGVGQGLTKAVGVATQVEADSDAEKSESSGRSAWESSDDEDEMVGSVLALLGTGQVCAAAGGESGCTARGAGELRSAVRETSELCVCIERERGSCAVLRETSELCVCLRETQSVPPSILTSLSLSTRR